MSPTLLSGKEATRCFQGRFVLPGWYMNCIGRMLWGRLTAALQLLELSCSLSDCLWVLAEHRENSLHALSPVRGGGKFRSPWDWGWVKLTFPIFGGKCCNTGSRFHLHSWGNGCCRCGCRRGFEMSEGARRWVGVQMDLFAPHFLLANWDRGIALQRRFSLHSTR